MRRLLALLLVLSMGLSMAACGAAEETEETIAPETTEATTEETVPPFDIDEYKTAVWSCSSKMYENSIILYNLANYENTYWESLEKLSGTVTPEDLINSALEWLEKKGGGTESEITAQYEAIKHEYKEIVSTEISGTEAEEIKKIYDEYFDAYLSFYKLVFSPSGTIGDFVENINNCINTIENCNSKLEILVS